MPSLHTNDTRLLPRKLARQERAQITVDAIIEAASQVFGSLGYASATTNRIAERAGVSIGSLYQYFPNKDAILVALARQHLTDALAMLAPQLQRLNEGTPWEEVLPDVVEAMVAMHAVAPLLHQSLFEETRLPKIVWEELEAQERTLVGVIARALAADPACSAKDQHLAASVVVNVIESLTHRLVLHPPAGSNPAAVSREITSLVRAYLRTSSA